MSEIADAIAWLRHTRDTTFDPADFWEDDPDQPALDEFATLQAAIAESVSTD